MQSPAINTRTGLITAKLFVTLHRLMQEWGKRLHRLSYRIKPSLGFLRLSVIAFPALSPTNMSWFSPVGCCSSQCRVPKQTPAFPQGVTLCAVAGYFHASRCQGTEHQESSSSGQRNGRETGLSPLTAINWLQGTIWFSPTAMITSGLSQMWAYWGCLDSKCVPGTHLLNLPIGIEQIRKTMRRKRWGVSKISTRKKKKKAKPPQTLLQWLSFEEILKTPHPITQTLFQLQWLFYSLWGKLLLFKPQHLF